MYVIRHVPTDRFLRAFPDWRAPLSVYGPEHLAKEFATREEAEENIEVPEEERIERKTT